MNKYLLMSAAAVLASTGAANAGTHSFTFATSGGTPFCDGGTVTTGLGGGVAAAWIHTNANCASATSQGAGFGGKDNKGHKVWYLSDNYLAKFDGMYNETTFYVFNKSFTKWSAWICLSGFSCFEGGNGSLINGAAGAHGVKNHGNENTLARVRQLIAARRQ